jgi:methyl-accepting chemotaxis protein
VISFFWLMGTASPTGTSVAIGLPFVMITASIGIGFYSVRGLSSSLDEATEAVKAVSQGNLAGRINISSRDRLGEMGGYFKSFLETLFGALSQEADSGKKISFASNTLDATAEQMIWGVDEIVSETTSASSASEEMASTSAEIARYIIQ